MCRLRYVKIPEFQRSDIAKYHADYDKQTHLKGRKEKKDTLVCANARVCVGSADKDVE